MKIPLMITTMLLLMSCEQKDYHTLKLSDYKGAILVGEQYDFDEPVGVDLYSFKRGDSIWSVPFKRSVMASYRIGDSIK